ALLPPGIEARPMGAREYSFLSPGMAQPVRVSTDPAYYEENADSVELWSPGNPTFPAPEDAAEAPTAGSLSEVLSRVA
ncbi:hypothetical protein OFC13_29445, partial [Escherichia coli]|nr:hypothetical protein [Escherichia coli]